MIHISERETERDHQLDLEPEVNLKPVWQTEELSQEWLIEPSLSPSSSHLLHPPTTTTNSRHPSLRIASNSSSSRIPIRSNLSLPTRSASHPRRPPIPSLTHSDPQPSPSSSTSTPADGSSIVVNSNLPPDPTPPWLKAAVDGMVHDVLGKRPGPLQKIFQHPHRSNSSKPSSPRN